MFPPIGAVSFPAEGKKILKGNHQGFLLRSEWLRLAEGKRKPRHDKFQSCPGSQICPLIVGWQICPEAYPENIEEIFGMLRRGAKVIRYPNFLDIEPTPHKEISCEGFFCFRLLF